jgi:hypothetical protein
MSARLRRIVLLIILALVIAWRFHWIPEPIARALHLYR